jgi:transposase
MTLGYNAYEDGTAAEFRDCYDPTWGKYKARTKPSPGNYDYPRIYLPRTPANSVAKAHSSRPDSRMAALFLLSFREGSVCNHSETCAGCIVSLTALVKSSLPEDEALGRSRGGYSTKLHLTCDGKCRPLSVVVAPGQCHGSTQLEELLDTVRAPPPEGAPGRPSKRPAPLLAHRGHSFEGCRGLLRRRGISHAIPERKYQRDRRVAGPGRRPDRDREAYRRRNVVERCVNRLKQ